MMNDDNEHPFDPMDCWLHENMVPGPWQQLNETERKELALMARRRLQFETLEERGRDSLDFREVSVWQVREALARAYLAGAQREAP
jgi:hypothetical protein